MIGRITGLAERDTFHKVEPSHVVDRFRRAFNNKDFIQGGEDIDTGVVEALSECIVQGTFEFYEARYRRCIIPLPCFFELDTKRGVEFGVSIHAVQ